MPGEVRGQRIDIVATLRAASRWQRVRPRTDRRVAIRKELNLQFVLGYQRDEFAMVLDMLAAKRIDAAPLVTAGMDSLTSMQAPVKQRKPPPRAGGPGRRTTTGYLVVVETPAMETALLVDEVLPIEVVPASRIDEASGSVRGVRSEYVRGIASGQQLHHDASGRSLVILDLLALLGDGRLIVYDELG